MREACRSIQSGQPDISFAVLIQFSDHVIGQPVVGGKGPELTILKKSESAAISADPQTAFVVFLKCPDFVIAQAAGLDGKSRETMIR